MYNYKFLFFALVFTLSINGQNSWQQNANYKIYIDVDVKKNTFKGSQEVLYTNNSPDTLNKVFFHLYFNAFRPESDMAERLNNGDDNNRRFDVNIKDLEPHEYGQLKVNNLKQDGLNIDSFVSDTILEVTLTNPILPGESSLFTMNFNGQIPITIRRAGRDSPMGVKYSMAQWYPKISEYDYEGWNTAPYTGREFHGVWGDFDVTIKIDKDFIVAASGYIQETDPNNNKLGYLSGKKRVWNFKAPKVHDFTWAADPEYIHDIYPGPNGVKLNFYYKNDPKIIANWKTLQPVTAELMDFFNNYIGEYPYKQYSVVQGGDGGMEYSMLTLLNYGEELIPLISVTSHELAHAWFQGVLATNEMNHAWMDEGSASYFGELAESHVFNIDFHPIFTERPYQDYISLATSGQEMPLATNANRFKFNRAYEDAAYDKGFVFLSQLNYIIGEKAFEKTIKNYFDKYKFTHPLPNDLRRVAEQSSGILLNWYLTDWTQTTNQIDYAIKNVESRKKKSVITLERIGLMPMPLEILVRYKDGDEEFYYIPISLMRGEKSKPEYADKWIQLEDWSWAYKKYEFEIKSKMESIKSIDINPTGLLADVDTSNNIIKFE
ncbi:M1 family metallopeptidase [Flavobacteriaceae bacterium]|nr:M1 family metallopeptidase [Flavobacteriaceae bacterium]